MIKRLTTSFNKDQVGNLHYKDCSLKFLLKQKPELNLLIKELEPHFKKSNFITFDYQELNVNSSTPTCRSTDWHTDGKDNDYLIACWGDSRTEFLKSNVEELESQCLYSYTSSDLHRGRVLKSGEYRVFLRVCFSNYIKPNNKILRFPESNLKT